MQFCNNAHSFDDANMSERNMNVVHNFMLQTIQTQYQSFIQAMGKYNRTLSCITIILYKPCSHTTKPPLLLQLCDQRPRIVKLFSIIDSVICYDKTPFIPDKSAPIRVY